MKEFNFENYKEWFNKNYSFAEMSQEERDALPDEQGDFRLDEGWFPEDGETGIYEQGYEIGLLVFPEGMDIGTRDLAVAIPALGTEPVKDFNPELACKGEEFAEYTLDENDFKIVEKHLLGVDTKVMVLPFLPKYMKFYEDAAIDYTGIAPRQRLEDFLNEE